MTIVQQARFFAAITMPGASLDRAGSGGSPCGRGWACARGASTAEAHRNGRSAPALRDLLTGRMQHGRIFYLSILRHLEQSLAR